MSPCEQIAMCDRNLREVSNPGASGSLFYLSADDAFIIKTVQKKEARFLQKLLPGYYLVKGLFLSFYVFCVITWAQLVDTWPFLS